MSELIRRKDLENWLRTECASIDTYEDKEYVIGRLREDLPTVNQWNMVEDRLPDKNGRYLVFDRENGVRSALYIKQRKTSEWTDEVEEWCDFPVTHWMPLPEPPKEDS